MTAPVQYIINQKVMFKSIPFERVEWVTFIFLFGTLGLALFAVPPFLYFFEVGAFIWGLFTFYAIATGLSITLGYHRLYSHLAFKAKWPVRLFVTIFGAAAWENSILNWCSDHRRHHKHVDHDDDPYNINNGFWYAHIGWLLFKLKPEPPMDNVNDLRKSKLVMWQHRNVHLLAAVVGFVIPTLLGWWYYGNWQGALGGFLIVGILRTVFVQHATFCINSACHYFGNRPYSTKHSARDSWVMALFTYGEGYHNFHHEFQHDYRNGVKPWQWDPTKWSIWVLSKIGLTSELRRVSDAKILLAELEEARRRIDNGVAFTHGEQFTEAMRAHFQASVDYLENASEKFSTLCTEVQGAVADRIDLSKKKVIELRKEIDEAVRHLDALSTAKLTPHAI